MAEFTKTASAAPAADTDKGLRKGDYRIDSSEFFAGRERTGGNIEGNKEVIRKELIESYETYLTDYTRNLTDALKKDSTLLNHTIGRPDLHRHERELLAVLTTDGEVDPAKVKKFLSPEGKKPGEKARGLIITTQLIEQQTAMKLFALGLHARGSEAGKRTNLAEPEVMRVGGDRGALNKLVHDKILPLINRVNPDGRIARVLSTAVGLGIAGGVTTGMPEMAIAGALVGGGVQAAREGIEHSMREGLTLNLEQCVGAFQVIASNPDQVKYMKAVYGIDINDFQVNGERIEAKQGISHASINIEGTREDVLKGLVLREEFYNEIAPDLNGGTRVKLDKLPEEHLYYIRPDHAYDPEQTGTKWQQRIHELYNPNLAGIKDTADQTLGWINPATGQLEHNPHFDYGNVDYTGNIERFHATRVDVIMENLEAYLDALTDKPERTTAALKEKKASLGSDGEQQKKRKEKIMQREVALNNDQVFLDTEQGILDEYMQAESDLHVAQEGAGSQEQRKGLVEDKARLEADQVALRTFREDVTTITNARAAGEHGPRKQDLEADKRHVDAQARDFAQAQEVIDGVARVAGQAEAESARAALQADLDTLQNNRNALGEYQSAVQNIGEAGIQPVSEAERRRLEQDKNQVTQERDALAAYQAAEVALQSARDEVAKEFNFDTLQAIDAKTKELEDKIHGKGKEHADSVTMRRDKVYGKITRAYNAELKKAPTSFPSNRAREDWSKTTLDRITALHKHEIDQLVNEQTRLQAQIDQLNGLRGGLASAEKAVHERQTVVRSVDNLMTTLREDNSEILGFDASAHGEPQLSTEDLRTLSIDEIIQRIDQMHTASDTVGWSADEIRRNPQLRSRIEHAIVEARAQGQEARDTRRNAGDQVADYTAITGWGISEHDLRTRTEEELLKRIKSIYDADNTRGWEKDDDDNRRRLVNAITEAQNRVRVRLEAYNHQVGELEQQIEHANVVSAGATEAAGRAQQTRESQQESIRAGEVMLRQVQEDFSIITSWRDAAGNTLGVTELRSLTIDQVMERIFQMNDDNPDQGKPRGDRNNPAFRAQVERAIVEARAQAAEAGDTQHAARVGNYDTVRGWGISDQDLRTLTPDQLLVQIHARHARTRASGTAQGWEAGQDEANRLVLEQAIAEAQNRLHVRVQAFDQQIGRVNNQLSQAEEARVSAADIADAQRKVTEQERTLHRVDSMMVSMQGNFTEITTWAHGTIRITPDNLRVMSVEQVMNLINTMHQGNPDVGWAAGAPNSNPDLRQRVEQAIIEARARHIESTDQGHLRREDEFNAVITAGISEGQLRTLPQATIMAEAHRLHAAGGGGWPEGEDHLHVGEVASAIAESQNRLRIRAEAYALQQESLQHQIDRTPATPAAAAQNLEAAEARVTESAIRPVVELTSAMRESFALITIWDAGGVRITPAELRTWPVDAIIRKAIEINQNDNDQGWSAEDIKNNPNIRLQIERAIVEARAQEISPLVAGDGGDFDAVFEGGWGFTEEQLATQPLDQINSILDRIIQDEPGRAANRPSGPQLRTAARIARERLNARVAAFEQQNEALTRQIGRIPETAQEAEDKVKEAQEKLDAKGEVPKLVERTIDDLRNHFSIITSWGVAGGLDINIADLQTMTVEQVMSRINDIHKDNDNQGWAAGDNNNAAYRRMVEHAIVEARAQAIDEADAGYGVRIGDFVDIRGWGVTEHELRTLPEADLLQRIHDIHRATGNGWDAAGDTQANREMLQRAMQEANLQVRHRIDAYAEQRIQVARQVESIQLEYARGTASKELLEQIDMTVDIFERIAEKDRSQDKLLPMLSDTRRHPDRYFDRTALVDTDTTYLARERKLSADQGGIPKAWFEMVNVLFGSREKLSSDPDYLQKVHKIMPPTRLAIFMNNSFGLGMGAAPAPDAVFDRVRVGVETGRIEISALRDAVWNITNQLYDEAIAA